MSTQTNPSSFKQIAKYVTIFLSSLVLLDMFIPGPSYESVIQRITINYESYFNAAGNGHDSYAIETENHSFYIDEITKENFSEGEEIQYRLSPIFNEIQHFQTDSAVGKTSSMRLYSGIFLPVFCLLVIGLSFRLKERLSILTFVCQVLIIADLIYLLI